MKINNQNNIDSKIFRFEDFEQFKYCVNFLEQSQFHFDFVSSIPLASMKRKNTSKISIHAISLIISLMFFVGIIFFQYYISSSYYRMNLGGKPFFNIITSIPFSLIITFFIALLSGLIAFLIKTKHSYVKYINKIQTVNPKLPEKFIIICDNSDELLTYISANNIKDFDYD